MGSNEASFIALAHFYKNGDMMTGWFRWWNGGMPVENTYMPLLPVITAAFSTVSGLDVWNAFHVVMAAIYCLQPVALFALLLWLGVSVHNAGLASTLFLLFSPSNLLFPVIGRDTGNLADLRRLYTIVFYGEGPHNLAILLIPLCLLLIWRVHIKPASGLRWALACFSCALLFLSNAFGITVLAIGLGCDLIAQNGWSWARLVRTIGIVTLTYFLVSPVLTTEVLHTFRQLSATSGGDFRQTSWSWAATALVPVMLFVVRRLLRSSTPQQRFSMLFYLAIAAIPTLYYIWGLAIVPQPHRYHLETELGLMILIAFALEWLQRNADRVIWNTAMILIVAGCIAQFAHAIHFSREFIQGLDPATTTQAQMAQWIGTNLPGERIMVSGDATFPFNLFADNSQLSGGHDTSSPNLTQLIAVFTIYTGMNAGSHDLETSLTWLRAFGVKAVHVPSDSSYVQPYVNPREFEGVLPRLWSQQGHTLYEVQPGRTTLAHAIAPNLIVSQPPIHGLDITKVEKYTAGIVGNDADLAMNLKTAVESEVSSRIG